MPGAPANQEVLTRCPHCADERRWSSALIGSNVNCPACGRDMTVTPLSAAPDAYGQALINGVGPDSGLASAADAPPAAPETLLEPSLGGAPTIADPTSHQPGADAGADGDALARIRKAETIPTDPEPPTGWDTANNNAPANSAAGRHDAARLTTSDGLDAADLEASGVPSRQSIPPSRKVGDRIEGRFELNKRLGEGGMGAVYQAHDHRLGREVAVKFLTIPREDLKNRFLAEARTVAAFDHPNIIRVFDFGEDKLGPFIIMELLHGRDLEQVLNAERQDKNGGLPPERVRRDLIGPVAAALEYAHRRGVIHRDIKPSNVLLTDHGEIKVLDFGLARGMGTLDGRSLTVAGQGMGTPVFSAPEQFEDAKSVGTAADVFSFAATCYNLLTGQIPRMVRPELLPPTWRDAIVRGLDPDPARRFDSARDLLDAVDSATNAHAAQGGVTYVAPAYTTVSPAPAPSVPYGEDQSAPGNTSPAPPHPSAYAAHDTSGYAYTQGQYAPQPDAYGHMPGSTGYYWHPGHGYGVHPPFARWGWAFTMALIGTLILLSPAAGWVPAIAAIIGLLNATREGKRVRRGEARETGARRFVLIWNVIVLIIAVGKLASEKLAQFI